ncbi:MAG TPA: GDP-L-fucose synthase [Candidatus Methylacidiphilales bacterium]
MNVDSRIFIAGHKGLVGSACARVFAASGHRNLLLRSRSELDLRDAAAVDAFYRKERPEYVVVAAAKVGGIGANSAYPVDFLLHNLEIQNNLIRGAFEHGVTKLLFLGSTCIYPKLAPQPLSEESLLTGPLEPTNEAYAVAKIAGIKLCQAYAKQYGARFISAMPTNLYGIGDNFDLANSHVLPAMIRRFSEAKEAGKPSVTLWGDGTPRREFLFSDDLAEACLFLLKNYEDPGIINIGCGEDLSIRDLAALVAETVGYEGETLWDTSKPNGTPRKLVNVAKIRALGWAPKTPLADGLRIVADWWNETRLASKGHEAEALRL